jgi:chemotaxis protein MotA
MQIDHLFDPTSALIVVGGTVLATLMRCGLEDTRAALSSVKGLFGKHFDAVNARAELAAHVREIQMDGLLRAEPHHFGDAEFDDATDALIGSRSIGGLRAAHVAHKRRRVEQNLRAVRTFNQAADLAPVFGLAGTLVSLSQLPGASGDFAGAISMAVVTTLYGLLLGNLAFAPIARVVARVAAREEKERQKVLDWLEDQVVIALPGHGRIDITERAGGGQKPAQPRIAASGGARP